MRKKRQKPKRNKRVEIRMTEDEKNKLSYVAKRRGVSLGGYIANAALSWTQCFDEEIYNEYQQLKQQTT